MSMSVTQLLRWADTVRRLTTDPLESAWLGGYMRGLRRAHHGERFGTATEHELWMRAADAADPIRAARGRGYRAGLSLAPCDPKLMA